MGLLNNLKLTERLKLTGGSSVSALQRANLKKRLLIKGLSAALVISLFGAAAAADQVSQNKSEQADTATRQQSITIETPAIINSDESSSDQTAQGQSQSQSSSYTSITSNVNSSVSTSPDVSVTVNGQKVEVPASGSSQQIVESPNGSASISIHSSNSGGDDNNSRTRTSFDTNSSQSSNIEINSRERTRSNE